MGGGGAAAQAERGSSRAPAVYAYAVSLALCVLVALPGLRPLGYDSFPWSSYPMFSRARPREATVAHVLALSDDGRRRRPVPPPHLGSDEVMQASATIQGALRGGRAPDLCRRVAGRLAADPAWADFEWVEVASDRYDILDYFTGDRRPRARDVHTRCRIRR